MKSLFPPGAKKEENAQAASSSQEQQPKDEEGLRRILELTRNLFITHKINGSVEVTYGAFAFSTSVSVEINGSEEQPSPDIDESRLTPIEKAVMSGVRSNVDNLAHRAKNYVNASYKAGLTLSNAISISDPITGAFSMSVSLSASVDSLLASEK